MEKRQFKRRISALSMILVFLIVIYLFDVGLLSTISRYIKREQDEIVAYYTALYLDTDGGGKTIAFENKEGYIDFNLMNFIGEDVTQRDIEYTIKKPDVFYDKNGAEISDASSTDIDDIYVLDVWGEPKKVQRNTYLYAVEITENSGEDIGNGAYKFTYEKLGSSGVGKTHHITLKLKRNSDDDDFSTENVSIVVQLEKPYKEVFIIDVVASSKLVTFSTTDVKYYENTFKTINVQSADLYAYTKAGVKRTPVVIKDKTYEYTSKAFKLTFTWEGFILDENGLEGIQIGTNGSPDNNGSGSNINNDAYYLDIDRPVISKIDATLNKGELVIFVPQGSSFSLDFLPFIGEESEYKIDVKIEICLKSGGVTLFNLYSSEFFGYDHDGETNKYNLFIKAK